MLGALQVPLAAPTAPAEMLGTLVTFAGILLGLSALVVLLFLTARPWSGPGSSRLFSTLLVDRVTIPTAVLLIVTPNGVSAAFAMLSVGLASVTLLIGVIAIVVRLQRGYVHLVRSPLRLAPATRSGIRRRRPSEHRRADEQQPAEQPDPIAANRSRAPPGKSLCPVCRPRSGGRVGRRPQAGCERPACGPLPCVSRSMSIFT